MQNLNICVLKFVILKKIRYDETYKKSKIIMMREEIYRMNMEAMKKYIETIQRNATLKRLYEGRKKVCFERDVESGIDPTFIFADEEELADELSLVDEDNETGKNLKENKLDKKSIDKNLVFISGRIVNIYETDKVYIMTIATGETDKKSVKNFPKILFFKRNGIVPCGANKFSFYENVKINAHIISSVFKGSLTQSIVGDSVEANETLAIDKYLKLPTKDSLNNMLYQFDRNEFIITGTVIKKTVVNNSHLFMLSLNEYGKKECIVPLCYFKCPKNHTPSYIEEGMRIVAYGKVQTDYKPETREFFQAFDIKDMGIIDL